MAIAHRDQDHEPTIAEIFAADSLLELDRWTEIFARVLAKYGNVSDACKAAKVPRAVALAFKQNNPAFAERWTAAMAEAIDRLEQIAYKRAYSYSDKLLMFMLQAHRPDVYRKDTPAVRGQVSRDPSTGRVEFTLEIGERGDSDGDAASPSA